MQLITLASGLAASLLMGTASAGCTTSYNCNNTGNVDNRVKIVNNCPYKVYLWSILKGQGCPQSGQVVLNTGDFYHEQYREEAHGGQTGVSIKIAKEPQCKGVDITQLEYFETLEGQWNGTYLDVSYVDCLGDNCPGRKDGYYLKSGNVGKVTVADSTNTKCPTFHCTNKADCDKISYVLPDDVQTKQCDLDEPLDFYLCGNDAPTYEPEPEPSSSSVEEESTAAPTPTPTKEPVINAANVTPAPEPELPKTKVEYAVVTVTQFEYVNAKRHAHGHAHRHFRA